MSEGQEAAETLLSVPAEAVESKRPRKLIKTASAETMSVTIEVVGHDSDPVEYPLTELTPEIVDQLALHGLSQKLGDAAAGAKNAADAKSGISDTWDNLVAGKFRGERAGGERMPSKKDTLDRLSQMEPEQAAAARLALEALGIVLPE